MSPLLVCWKRLAFISGVIFMKKNWLKRANEKCIIIDKCNVLRNVKNSHKFIILYKVTNFIIQLLVQQL